MKGVYQFILEGHTTPWYHFEFLMDKPGDIRYRDIPMDSIGVYDEVPV